MYPVNLPNCYIISREWKKNNASPLPLPPLPPLPFFFFFLFLPIFQQHLPIILDPILLLYILSLFLSPARIPFF